MFSLTEIQHLISGSVTDINFEDLKWAFFSHFQFS
jgi:hypothetical protein